MPIDGYQSVHGPFFFTLDPPIRLRDDILQCKCVIITPDPINIMSKRRSSRGGE